MSLRSAGFITATIRSGRFTSDDATTAMVIIEGGKSGAFYRILNSGENDFQVNNGFISEPLGPTFSLDLAVVGSVSIQTGTAGKIEGVYEYLNTERPIRSGRFKKTMKASQSHKIIDLAKGGGQGPKAFYRILNSGEATFEVKRGAAVIKELASNQSFDFFIDKPSGPNRSVTVNPKLIPTEPDKDIEIDGIYDFLGQED